MPSSPPKFLPTPSARRATSIPPTSWPSGLSISTHALREEGDHDGRVAAIEHDGFLPTPSARRATTALRASMRPFPISTHALREEGDMTAPLWSWFTSYFYPRPPRGGRLSAATQTAQTANFYPRPPRGGRQQMCHKIKAIFWQYLHNWIQPTKKQSVFV